MKKKWVWVAVVVLLVVQAAQTVYVVHRESLTFDEGNHSFSGYMMWHTGDFGLNPEHPPLVKLLAALPALGRNLWVPKLEGRNFKAEAYLSGRDWLARNDGGSQHLLFQMRMATLPLALGLSLMVFLAAQEWFGTMAGLAALVLVSFSPNILAHSALVTTDAGVSLGFLAGIYTFYRYVKKPTASRLLVAGLAGGLLLATKHSGILLAPMLVLLIVWEIILTPRGGRGRVALRLSGALAAIVVMGVVVLWAFYGFRYTARPVGLTMSTSLADYVKPLSNFDATVVMGFAHLRLLPESYLIGLTDVKRMAQFYPTFILGRMYPHGVWWYFPVAILIKTTLGLMALVVLAALAVVTRRLRKVRELGYVLLPWVFYLLVAMAAGMNIGARHILPVYVLVFIFAGAGIAALAEKSRTWMWVGVALLAAHVVSALTVFPNYMAYANEAWGGPRNVHNLLSDANVDWGQQLYQVKAWQDRHPGEECWFAYFAYPEINPETYGITCHHLPNADTFWLGGADVIPPVISGNVLISAGDLSGCEMPSSSLNPYRQFQGLKPDAMIDYGVMVYRGTFDVKQAAALSRVQNAFKLLRAGRKDDALELAREAATIDPGDLTSQEALGNIALTMGNKDEAKAAFQAALEAAKKMGPDEGAERVTGLEKKLSTL
ncbi:MAG TPA: glycosyltransferase family 39 protein [Terracidiphilus sp.]|nr:glycosyltransferase family 39 protein [Terracidiphilus sp.]